MWYSNFKHYFKNDCIPLWRFSIPLILIGVSQSLIWFFQTLFLAHLGAKTLSAGALVSWLFGTLVVISLGTLGATNVLIAYRYGSNDHDGISQVACASLILALILALLSFGLLWEMPFIFLLFGQNPGIVLLAQHYLHALAYGLFPNFIMLALLELMIGLGHARTVLVFNILSVLSTIGFSFIFIFGKFGFPNLGIAGAGWGITISSCMMVVILGSFVYFDSQYRCYFKSILSFNVKFPLFSLLIELLKIGLPVGVMFCFEVAFFLALTLIMGAVGGSQWLAANQVVLQYLCLFMQIIFSIAQAITVRMGHLLGANNSLAAKRAAICGIVTSASLMGLASIFFWFFPTLLISVDFDVHAPQMIGLIAIIITLFKVSALFQIIESVRIALFGALRGLKDTRFPLLSSLIGFWLIPLPLGCWIVYATSLGPVGLWWSMVCGALMSASLLAYRFQYKIAVASDFYARSA